MKRACKNFIQENDIIACEFHEFPLKIINLNE